MTTRRQKRARAAPQRRQTPQPPTRSAAWPAWLVQVAPIASLVLVLALTTFVRLRLADVPLERDEGEYAYAGQLILQGIPPYSLAYNMKFPGTYYAYGAVMAVFGQSAWGVHVGLLVVNAATALLVFMLVRQLAGTLAASAAVAAFAMLSLDRWIMGVFAHATHFVLLPAMGGLVLLADAEASRRVMRTLAAGILLGLAVLMKQQALPFVALGLAWIVWIDWRSASIGSDTWRRAATLAGGALVPLAIICGLFAIQGVLDRFWFWTFQYAREYVSEVPLDEAWPSFQLAWSDITRATWPIWWLAIFGFAALWFARWSTDLRVRVTVMAAASVLSILPGFFFRQHYFIVILPVAALLVGVAVASLDRGLSRLLSPIAGRIAAIGILVLTLGAYVYAEREYLFELPTRDLSRAVYGANPFVESPEIARYIEERTSPDDRIVVFGSEPQVYFYSKRKSATGYIYTYALMEPQPYASRMQDEMMQEIEAASPKYVVAVFISTSWLARPNSDQRIVNWFDRYMRACYEQVGVVDIHAIDRTTVRWDGQLRGYEPRSKNLVHIYRRAAAGACTAR